MHKPSAGKHPKKHPGGTPPPPGGGGTPPPSGGGGTGNPPPVSGDPIFAQPQPSADPTGFKDPVMDKGYKQIANIEPVPPAAGGAAEPILTLEQIYGSAGAAKVAAIQQSGQIVFHSVGDTGSVVGPATQSLVADKLVSDFDEMSAADVPSFFFHLGDIVYYFGEGTYYYDQFYEPYRDYPAPIVGIAGNHDGVVYPGDKAGTLEAYLRNFCSPSPAQSPDSGGLLRTTMIQPGVYFTLEAPFVRVLGLYSNVLEDPGVISGENGGNTVLDDRQVTFLKTALARAKSENFAGAVVVAVHHPPFTGGSGHGGSPLMSQDIDHACEAAGFWPHAVFSGHAHNYQRYTRTVNGLQIPYLVAGCGGHSPLSAMRGTYRTPYKIDNTLTLESYDDGHFGYLRVVVNATTMRVEFHPQSDQGSMKTPDDHVTITLATHTVV